jgi:hypothetical protein
MLPAVKRAQGAAALAMLAAVAGCGDGAARTPGTVAAEGVRATVGDLERALAERDYERICEQILSSEGRRRAGGEECARRLARSTAGVEDPTLEVVSVELGPGEATAHVRAYSEGRRPAVDIMRLKPENGDYRIESLSGQ